MSVEEQILLKEILDQLQAGGITADISDRAARLLGVTYGSQGQQILQRAVSFDLLAQLRNAGIEIDPRSIRNLVFATDKVDISGSSLPLPTGASTEATLALVKAKTDNIPAQGQALMAASTPVAIASNQSAVPVSGTVTANLGTIADVATQTTLALVKAKTDNLDVLLSTRNLEATQALIKAKTDNIPAQGQALMAASTPVAIASNQSAVPISAASLPLPTGAATEATVALIKAKTDNLDVALSTRLSIVDIQPSSAGSIFNTALPVAEGNWFGADISITSAGTIRVTAQATVAGILRAAITRTAVTKTLNLNANASLAASALYAFDIPVKSGDTFNLRYSVTTGTIDYCEVQFIKGAA